MQVLSRRPLIMYKDVKKQKEAQHKGYLKNKDTVLARNKTRRLNRKKWLLDYLSDKCCVDCGEKNPVCLDFHHLDPSTKEGTVSRMINEFRSLTSILLEIQKCVIVCANCHRKRHADGRFL